MSAGGKGAGCSGSVVGCLGLVVALVALIVAILQLFAGGTFNYPLCQITLSPTFCGTPTPFTQTNTPNPPPTNTPNPPTVFEDFEDRQIPSDWQIKSGNWGFANTGGNFALNLNSGTGEITFGSEKWVDYELSFKVQTRDVSVAKALYVYVRDIGNKKLALAIDYRMKSISLVEIAPGISQGILYTLEFPFRSNWSLEFKLFVSKNWVTVYINELYFTYQRFDNTIDSGPVSLTTSDTTLLLDDIQVDLSSIKP